MAETQYNWQQAAQAAQAPSQEYNWQPATPPPDTTPGHYTLQQAYAAIPEMFGLPGDLERLARLGIDAAGHAVRGDIDLGASREPNWLPTGAEQLAKVKAAGDLPYQNAVPSSTSERYLGAGVNALVGAAPFLGLGLAADVGKASSSQLLRNATVQGASAAGGGMAGEAAQELAPDSPVLAFGLGALGGAGAGKLAQNLGRFGAGLTSGAKALVKAGMPLGPTALTTGNAGQAKSLAPHTDWDKVNTNLGAAINDSAASTGADRSVGAGSPLQVANPEWQHLTDTSKPNSVVSQVYDWRFADPVDNPTGFKAKEDQAWGAVPIPQDAQVSFANYRQVLDKFLNKDAPKIVQEILGDFIPKLLQSQRDKIEAFAASPGMTARFTPGDLFETQDGMPRGTSFGTAAPKAAQGGQSLEEGLAQLNLGPVGASPEAWASPRLPARGPLDAEWSSVDNDWRQAQEFSSTATPPMDWQFARRLLTSIGNELGDPKSRIALDLGKTRLEAMYAGLSHDLESTAASYGPEALSAFQQARAESARLRTIADGPVKQILESKAPADVLDGMATSTSADSTALSQLRSEVPYAVDQMAGTALTQMGNNWESKASSAVKAPSGQINPSFSRQWGALANSIREALIPDPLLRERINAIAGIQDNMIEAQKVKPGLGAKIESRVGPYALALEGLEAAGGHFDLGKSLGALGIWAATTAHGKYKNWVANSPLRARMAATPVGEQALPGGGLLLGAQAGGREEDQGEGQGQ